MNNGYKNRRSDKVWWLDNSDRIGEFVFSFDRKTAFNLFADYPWTLTQEQKAIFDAGTHTGRISLRTAGRTHLTDFITF